MKERSIKGRSSRAGEREKGKEEKAKRQKERKRACLCCSGRCLIGTRYVDHDQRRETVPILVRPRDDDSGTVSDRAGLPERLSLTFATPMMDRRAGLPRARAPLRSNSTEIKSKYIYRQFGAMSDLAELSTLGRVGDRASLLV